MSNDQIKMGVEIDATQAVSGLNAVTKALDDAGRQAADLARKFEELRKTDGLNAESKRLATALRNEAESFVKASAEATKYAAVQMGMKGDIGGLVDSLEGLRRAKASASEASKALAERDELMAKSLAQNEAEARRFIAALQEKIATLNQGEEVSLSYRAAQLGIADAAKGLIAQFTALKQAEQDRTRAHAQETADADQLRRAIDGQRQALFELNAAAKGTAEYFEQLAAAKAYDAGKFAPMIAELRQVESELSVAIAKAKELEAAQAFAQQREAAMADFKRLEYERDLNDLLEKRANLERELARISSPEMIRAFDEASLENARRNVNARAPIYADEYVAEQRAAENLAAMRERVINQYRIEESAIKADAAAAEQLVAAQNTLLASLEAQANAVGKTGSELHEMKVAALEARAAQLGISDQAAPFIATLRSTTGSIHDLNVESKELKWALRLVPAQFTDIVTSLAAGQNPMMVFIQQGGQLKDMFGGMGAAARAMAGYVAGLITPINVSGAAVAAYTVALVKGEMQTQDMNRAIVATGNFAGVTRQQMLDLGKETANATHLTIGASREIVQALVASGQISHDVIAGIARDVDIYAQVIGKDAQEATSALIRLFADPAKGAVELNKSMHLLNGTELLHIQNLQEQGRFAEAQVALEGKLSEHLKAAEQNLGDLQRAWEGIKKAASGAWDAMLGVGRPQTLKEEIDEIRHQLATGGLDFAQDEGQVREYLARLEKRYADEKTKAAADQKKAADSMIESKGMEAAGAKSYVDQLRQLSNEEIQIREALAKVRERTQGKLASPEDKQEIDILQAALANISKEKFTLGGGQAGIEARLRATQTQLELAAKDIDSQQKLYQISEKQSAIEKTRIEQLQLEAQIRKLQGTPTATPAEGVARDSEIAALNQKRIHLAKELSATLAEISDKEYLDDLAAYGETLTKKGDATMGFWMTWYSQNLPKLRQLGAQLNEAITAGDSGEEAKVRARIDLLMGAGQMGAAKKESEQRKAMDAEVFRARKQAAEDSLRMDELLAEREYALGNITKQQLLEQQQQFEDSRFEIEQMAQAERITALLGDPTMDPVALQKLLNEMAEIQRKHAMNGAKIQTDAAVENKNRWEQMLSPIGSAVNKTVTGMIQGTLTLRKGLSNIFQSIFGEFVNLCTQMGTKWAAMELAKTMATTQNSTLRTVLEKAGLISAAQTAVSTSSTVATAKSAEAAVVVPAEAAEAAGGAASAVAGIPIVGPALAAAAFAAIMAMVMGGLSGGGGGGGSVSVPSAAGGFDIPAGTNPLTQLHEKEMVLPSRYAETIRGLGDIVSTVRNAISGALLAAPVLAMPMSLSPGIFPTQGIPLSVPVSVARMSSPDGIQTPSQTLQQTMGGSTTQVTYSPTIHAMDGASVKRVLMEHQKVVFDAVAAHGRNLGIRRS